MFNPSTIGMVKLSVCMSIMSVRLSMTLCTVVKRYILQQKCIVNKWIRSAIGTRFYNFLYTDPEPSNSQPPKFTNFFNTVRLIQQSCLNKQKVRSALSNSWTSCWNLMASISLLRRWFGLLCGKVNGVRPICSQVLKQTSRFSHTFSFPYLPPLPFCSFPSFLFLFHNVFGWKCWKSR